MYTVLVESEFISHFSVLYHPKQMKSVVDEKPNLSQTQFSNLWLVLLEVIVWIFILIWNFQQMNRVRFIMLLFPNECLKSNQN